LFPPRCVIARRGNPADSLSSRLIFTFCIYEEKMKEEFRKKINEIMAGMHCPKDFKCAATGLNQLCKARDVGLDNYLECLEENRQGCPFALSFGNGYFCQCPLRVYLAKKLKT
jgi:hypothetical protein